MLPRFGDAHPVGGPVDDRPATDAGERGPELSRTVPATSIDQFKRHARNFLECVRSRRTPISDLESAHRVATACHLANLSLRLGRKLRWDAAPRNGSRRRRSRGLARAALPGALGRRAQRLLRKGMIHANDPTFDARRAVPATVSGPAMPRPSDAPGGEGSLGLVIHSFAGAHAGDRGRASRRAFLGPARFLEHARALGARGVQVGLGVLDDAAADALRERARAASMYLEGIVALPRDQADMERFEAEIRTAKRVGAQVVRTVMLSGRRYETFANIAEFRRFAESSTHALKLAAPVVARHDIRLAVENHKDWRADELIRVLKQAGNDHVGVCLDTGNSIALLEDPMEVVEALAPRAFTTHFKDMVLEEYRDGFLLSEVPLGEGILDLPRVDQDVARRPARRFVLTWR